MKKIFKYEPLYIGLALFSMFFGAGNIIFPLSVGHFAQDKNFYAMLGLLMTAALMPIVGVMAMILFKGNTREFFARLGRWPGFILALIIISLLGPLGSTPRCIALSYTTLKSTFSNVSLPLFSLGACGVIYLFTMRKTHLLSLLGWILTPLLLLSLAIIITLGLISDATTTPSALSRIDTFMHGVKEGYNTMDLLAAFFFSSTILNILKTRTASEKSTLRTAVQAALIGAALLAIVYIGFSYLAALHGSSLQLNSPDEILSAITLKIAPTWAAPLVCTTIALACLTTAIALIASFADFIHSEILQNRVSYKTIVIASLALTFFVSTFRFEGISSFLCPTLQICYPGLIVLTLLNIVFYQRQNIPIKVPVFFTFALSALYYFA